MSEHCTQGFSSYGRLGELLLEKGLISLEQLRNALKIHFEKGGFLGNILVSLGYISEEDIISCLVTECKVHCVRFEGIEISKEALRVIPEELCRRRYLVSIDKWGKILTVAMVDPLDVEALQEIKDMYREMKIKTVLCSWKDFNMVFEKRLEIK